MTKQWHEICPTGNTLTHFSEKKKQDEELSGEAHMIVYSAGDIIFEEWLEVKKAIDLKEFLLTIKKDIKIELICNGIEI